MMIRLPACIVSVTFALGCGAPKPPQAEPNTAASQQTAAPSQSSGAVKPDQDRPGDRLFVLPVEINTARSAAMLVAHMPPVSDPRTRQEILLHAALYRAACASRASRAASQFLLEPLGDGTLRSLRINRREFHVRVLAALADLGVPIAWGREGTRRRIAEGYFPGTHERATRLGIHIIQRIEEQATVLVEISDRTPRAGSSRQRVIATWDGQRWAIEPDRLRTVW